MYMFSTMFHQSFMPKKQKEDLDFLERNVTQLMTFRKEHGFIGFFQRFIIRRDLTVSHF